MSAPATNAPIGVLPGGIALLGGVLVVLYTVVISSADAITKFISHGYAAPQLFCVSGGLVAALCYISARARGGRGGLRTGCPRALALRAALTVAGSVAFFEAFRQLPFAEVFLFIGMVPIFAGLLSGLILDERVRPTAWTALLVGFVGVLFLFPEGLASVSFGHGVALLACLAGALSMVLARYIGKRESNSLAQVFHTNLALCLVMGIALPFVYRPMPLADMLWVLAYAGCLFAARWLLVVSLRMMPAYVVTPLMNLQFIWMVVLGAVFFGEWPPVATYLGVVIVIGSGLFLIYDQSRTVPAVKRSAG
ncbi:EamA-like transporter family protein [Salinihabitans flavidus]|uniref:EamA-like transporter family protein n=1 Tax=Salinihabitans flavidus TaxID=569882 RepID=A0A1H8QHR7_9RHOB|nr:DMT family transporter [Salinihabitans flavidus]SEO53343.1 EamA-like transporter family protein [Salinihabitans flavidus]